MTIMILIVIYLLMHDAITGYPYRKGGPWDQERNVEYAARRKAKELPVDRKEKSNYNPAWN